MSRLLEKPCKEAKVGNKDIVSQVRHISNKFLNAVEISAQEAVYLVLQMPLRQSSRQVQFINTAHPDDRTFLLKIFDKIRDLPDNSDDIDSVSLIKRYQRRPRKLEDMCIADFAALYQCVKQPRPSVENGSGYLPECDFEDENEDDPYSDSAEGMYQNESLILKGGIKLIKRQKPKVIRSVRFNKSKDPDNYFREQLMLYVPWRNEATDIIEHYQSYQERYEKLDHLLSVNRMKYEYHTDILEKTYEDMNTLDSDEIGNISPCMQHNDELDLSTERKESESFGCFHPGENTVHSQYDLLDDVGIFPRLTEDESLSATKPIDDTDYRCLVRSLNREQMDFFTTFCIQ